MATCPVGAYPAADHKGRRIYRHGPAADLSNKEKELAMDLLWTLAIILLILWLVGLVTSYTLGGFIHILLVLAIIVILIRVIQGRRAI
jgi:hypothetical protein